MNSLPEKKRRKICLPGLFPLETDHICPVCTVDVITDYARPERVK